MVRKNAPRALTPAQAWDLALTALPSRSAPRSGLIDALTHAEDQENDDVTSSKPERRWLLDTGAAHVLEPVADIRHDCNDAYVILTHEEAYALLPVIPDEVLDTSRMWKGPILREMLTATADHPGRVRAFGWVSWGYSRNSLILNRLEIQDPAFSGLVPDIVLLPPPAYVDELNDELRKDYDEHRGTCLYSSVVRQQWHVARAKYGLRSAESPPLRPDLDGLFVPGPGGTDPARDAAALAAAIGRCSSVSFRWK